MKKTFLLTLIVISLTISCSSADPEPNSNEENTTIKDDPTTPPESSTTCSIVNKDGLLIIEGESFELKGDWRIVDDEKASGGKYIEYYGANNYQTPNLAQEITIKFKVDAPGNYRVRWYMRQPDEAEGDKSNDVWIYLSDNIGYAWVNNASLNLKQYEKFVSRGKVDFTYGGALDLHNPKSSSWLTAKFPTAGEYTLKICGRSELFQLDKLVLSSGITDDEAKAQSQTQSETQDCN